MESGRTSARACRTAPLVLLVAAGSAFLHAGQPAGHLPQVGSYGSLLSYTIALDGDYACVGTTAGVEFLRIDGSANVEKLSSIDTLRDARCVIAR